jgi:hypothetical protein
MPSSIVIAAAQAYGLVTGLMAAYPVFSLAVNFAISYVVNRVFGAKPPRQQDNGVRQQIPPSADNSLPVVYGDAWLGGTFVDAVLTSDNQAMYYVLAISNISPNGQFTFDTTQFYYGDRLVTFAPGTNQVASLTDGAGNVDTKINGYLYINLYTSTAAGTITTVLGTAPNVAMGGTDIPVGLRWPASGRQMNGLAFAIVYLKYNTDAGSTGLQPLTFKVKHALNGTGVAKPGSVLKDYLTNAVYGGAVPLANVNTAACDDLDTYSDQLITYTPSGGGSATQARYRINGVIDTGETALNNIENILIACDSWISYQAETGQWTPVINKAESSGFAFNDSNIIGDIRVSATDITSSINQVELSFPWKENKDKPGYVFLDLAVLNPSLLYPNEPVNKYTATLSMVNDSVQAQYLGNRMLEQAREDLIVSFNTAYPGIQVNAGDVVSVTNSAYGWTDKLFRVIKVNETSLPDGNLGARFELSEYNAQVYDDATVTAFTPAPNSSLQSGYYFPALSAPTFSDQSPSTSPPTFSVTCQLPSTVRVTGVSLFYTTTATPSQSDWRIWATQIAPDNNAFAPAASIKFTNVTIGAGTYYFAFLVNNEISTSSLSAVSSPISWTPVTPSGPPGADGTSSRICFARVAGNPSPVSGTVTTVGNSSYPSSAQSLTTWGFAATWGASDPNPSSTNSLYQSDGTYDPATGLTTWTTPYISSLKVGQLSAITTNTGTLTIDSTGYLRGGQTDYNTGTGFFLGYSGSAYKFSIGSSSQSLLWDGTSLTLNGNIISSGKAQFDGNNSDLLGTAVKANTGGAADVGVAGFAGPSSLGRGISGQASATSAVGVVGSISTSAARAAILANCTGTATVALELSGGRMITDNSTLVNNLNADLLDGKHASAFVEIASGTTNGAYIYYVNNNTAPTDPTNRAAWIRVATNSGSYVYFPGYL